MGKRYPAAPTAHARRLAGEASQVAASALAYDCPVLDFFQAVVLGLIQGLTEFLPISSSAHLGSSRSGSGWG